MNFFLWALFIAIVKCIDDAFANGHSDAITVILAKSRGFGHTQTHLLGEINALDLRRQRDFQVLGVLRHSEASPAPDARDVGALWVTYVRKESQWSSRPRQADCCCRGSTRAGWSMLGPVRAVQGAVLNGFAEMAGLDVFRGIEIGDGPGDL